MKANSQTILALTAMIISISTLFVYLYQARIMQRQQTTSVWPYLQWGSTNTLDGAYIELQNKGIGPAIVRDVSIRMNGKDYSSFKTLFESLGDTQADNYFYSSVQGKVLAPGDKVQPFFIQDGRLGSDYLKAMKEQAFEYTICYCVYDDCWITYGSNVTQSYCSAEDK